MMLTANPKRLKYILLIAMITSLACTRKDIEFGTVPENGYTDIVYIDTVGVELSTIITDSFPTSGASAFLVGRYKDPYLGSVTTGCYFQLTKPTSLPEIPASAVFDSLTLILKPSDYYYGDTSKPQTYIVSELAQTITHSYNERLYNTSSVPVLSPALGNRTIAINPLGADSVSIRLDNIKGSELFSKLRQSTTEMKSETEFLNYFRGLSLSISSGDSAAVYGIKAAAGDVLMRVHYHLTIPYPESHVIDFPSLANDLAFNRIIPVRTGTGLVAGTGSTTEVLASLTGDRAFSQPGSGLALKLKFPSLSSLLSDKTTIKLLRAELLLRPAAQSFDRGKYMLPASIYLAQTDASNLVGYPVLDSAGANTQYASPVIDDIYGENNYYRFNVTNYIASMLTVTGAENRGFLIQEDQTVSGLNRLIIASKNKSTLTSQLLLTVLIINK